jgi:hypothetical protein
MIIQGTGDTPGPEGRDCAPARAPGVTASRGILEGC